MCDKFFGQNGLVYLIELELYCTEFKIKIVGMVPSIINFQRDKRKKSSLHDLS